MKIEFVPIAILFGFIATGVTKVNGQDLTSSTLSWKGRQVTDGRTSATKASTNEFVTHSSRSVEWIQKNGELKTSFQVVGVEGSWTNVSEGGSITYLLEYDGHSCKMRFERSASEVLILMDFDAAGDTSKRLTFKIDSVQ